jgi:hypothetical protein
MAANIDYVTIANTFSFRKKYLYFIFIYSKFAEENKKRNGYISIFRTLS